MSEDQPRRLLNPFAFPSETELRFILLVWAILSLCWGVGFVFTTALTSAAGWPALNELPELERDVLGTALGEPGFSLAKVAQRERELGEKLAGLSEPEARSRIDAALARLSRAAHKQWTATLPFLVAPFVALARGEQI